MALSTEISGSFSSKKLAGRSTVTVPGNFICSADGGGVGKDKGSSMTTRTVPSARCLIFLIRVKESSFHGLCKRMMDVAGECRNALASKLHFPKNQTGVA